MKSRTLLGFTVLVVAFGFFNGGTASAQDQSGSSQQGGALSTLSGTDKMKLLKVRQEVLANNPDLKAEQEKLTSERAALKNEGADASQEDRMTLLQNFMDHEKKMKAAMLQVDPTLQPIIDKLDEQMKERFQQHAAQGSGN